MNRRLLLKNSLFTAMLAGIPRIAWPANAARSGLTIGQILATAFPAVKAHMLDGHDWVAPELRKAARSGRIGLQSLGAVVEGYPVYELSIPIVWSARDDAKTPKEHQKISLVTSLLEHAFAAHDDRLLEKLGNGQAVASREYRYERGNIYQVPEGPFDPDFFVVKLFTALAFIS